jgi:hypothetical protein
MSRIATLSAAVLLMATSAFAHGYGCYSGSYCHSYSPSYCYNSCYTPSYCSNYCYTPSYSCYTPSYSCYTPSYNYCSNYCSSDYCSTPSYNSCNYSNWTYDNSHGYYYCTCNFRGQDGGFNKYYCIYNSSYGNCVYYYNPQKQMYWGRYDVASKGFSTLGDADQHGTIAELPQDRFSAPVAQLAIPGGANNQQMIAPPGLPTDNLAASAAPVAPPQS